MKLEIKETKNLDQFVNTTNRKVSKNHVQNLVVSMSIKGFDKTHPLRVSDGPGGKLTVLDGQHRLAAAKELSLPVTYIKIEENTDGEDVYFSNAFSKGWVTNDFVDYWCQLGKEPYIYLREFVEKHDVNIYTALTILGAGARQNRNQSIRLGQLHLTEDNKIRAEGLMKNVNEVRYFDAVTTSMSKQHCFVRALSVIVTQDFYNHNRMLNSLGRRSATLIRCARLSDYLRILVEIYNHKARNKVMYDGKKFGKET